MPELCTHPTRTTYHEPDGEGGFYIITICTVCMQELGRVHVIG